LNLWCCFIALLKHLLYKQYPLVFTHSITKWKHLSGTCISCTHVWQNEILKHFHLKSNLGNTHPPNISVHNFFSSSFFALNIYKAFHNTCKQKYMNVLYYFLWIHSFCWKRKWHKSKLFLCPKQGGEWLFAQWMVHIAQEPVIISWSMQHASMIHRAQNPCI